MIIVYLGGEKEIKNRKIPHLPTLKYPELEGILDLPDRVREFVTQNQNADIVIVTVSDIVSYTLRLMAKRGELNTDVVLYDLEGKRFVMDKADPLFSYCNENGEINCKNNDSISYSMLVELVGDEKGEAND